jgi:hypothetical protein
MKKLNLIFVLAVTACLLLVSTVAAQSEGLTIGLSRDWGYGGFNGDIQGTFSIKVSGPANLSRVEFYLDQTLLGEDTSTPFALQFLTDDYPAGLHMIYAVGFLADGTRLETEKISAMFVSKADSKKSMLTTLVPILVIVFGAILLSSLVPLISRKKGKVIPAGAPRSYTFGGGICPKCKRPFGFQPLSMNMIAGKFTPCPHCGKWSIVRREPLEILRAAEQAELAEVTTPIPEMSEEEKLRRGLDDSKFQNM